MFGHVLLGVHRTSFLIPPTFIISDEITMSQTKKKPFTLLAATRDAFSQLLGDADGPWTLAFAVLVSGYAMRVPGVVLLEGPRPVTSLVAGHVLSMFPKASTHRETAGFRGLCSHIAKAGDNRARLLHVPDIDMKIHMTILGLLDNWFDDRGYAHDHIDSKTGDRVQFDLGFAGVIATCEQANLLPTWFTNLAWILNIDLTDEQLAAIQSEPSPELDAIRDRVAKLPALGISVHDDHARALMRSVVGSPNARLHQSQQIQRLVNVLTVLGADASAVHGDALMDQVSDVVAAKALLQAARPRPRPLLPGERVVYERIRQLASTARGGKPGRLVAVETSEIYHLSQDLGVTERTIRNWLAKMVHDGLLIQDNNGVRNTYRIACTVNIDEVRLEAELTQVGGGGARGIAPVGH
jgi:hypothetical protein